MNSGSIGKGVHLMLPDTKGDGSMLRILIDVNNKIQKALQAILIVIASVLLAVNIAQIIGRNVFFYSLPWSEQLSTALFIWSIFLGIHLVVQEDGELKIEVLHFKSLKKQLLLEAIQDAFSLVMIVIFLISSILFLQNSIQFPQKVSSLPIDMSVIYSVMPVSFFLLTLQKFANLLERLEKWRTFEKSDNQEVRK